MTPTREQLKRIFPAAKPAILNAVLDQIDLLAKAKIDTPDRLTGFFASIGVESGGLTVVEENLRYSAARLRQVFPKYYKTDAQAAADAGNAKKIAIRVYGGRLGNAKAPSDEAWRFRGGGLMQTTGRTNYAALGYESNPEALRDPAIAFQTAVREWQKRGCNKLADKDDWRGVRKAINGGLNGFNHFMTYVAKASKVFAAARPVGLFTAAEQPVETKTYDDEETVRFVQIALSEKGYTEVGGLDGTLGKYTIAGILAFRQENDLPLVPVIDDALLDALSSAPNRDVAPQRAGMSSAETVKIYPEAKTSWYAQAVGAVSAGGAAVIGYGKDFLDNIAPSSETLRPLQELLDGIPTTVWVTIIIAVTATSAWLARRTIKQTRQAARDGRRR